MKYIYTTLLLTLRRRHMHILSFWLADPCRLDKFTNHTLNSATFPPRLLGGLSRLLWLLRLLVGAQVRLLFSVAQRGPKSHQL